MKTVAHYINSPYLGKTETWIYNQIKFLKDFEPTMYCHGIYNRELFPLERVRNVNMTENPTPARWERVVNKVYHRWALLRVIQQDRPDLVHAHYGTSGYVFLPYKRKFRMPLVTTFYGYDVNMLPTQDPRWRTRYRHLFAEGDLFLTEGSFMKQCLVNLGCDEKKVVVQHLGVDLDKIRFGSRQFKPGEELSILIAGSFREKKGIPYALEAIGLLRQRRPAVKVKVNVIGDSGGQAREEKEKRRILAVVQEYKLGADVKFLGYQPHAVFIDELYKNHIFLSPSVCSSDGDTEGGAPVSIIEAAASGLPVISTTHCDIPEVVIEGKTGFLVPERNTDALASALEFLLDHYEVGIERAMNGRAHIEFNYEINKQARHLDKIYGRLC